VIPVSDDVRKQAFGIVTKLRDAGKSADIDIMGRKMGKALKYAAGIPARYAVIVGASELEKGVVTLRDMESGDQKEVPLSDL
jgi:histidyl-tRNA synthetase